MSNLLVHSNRAAADGVLLSVTPESAGWRYVGFEMRALKKGQSFTRPADKRELCAVALSGKARLRADDFDLGSSASAPTFSPVCHGRSMSRRGARSSSKRSPIASSRLCAAPAEGRLPPRVIPPTEVEALVRGAGSNARHIRNILPETAAAESLLVVEVITPGGHWSSYPPHKHDRDAFPEETLLEETYYHRLSPPQGFAFQRVYTDDRSLDETMSVEDGDVVLVPRGYHPVGAPHGYDLYYLNVMAGPKRMWRFHNDPAHEWLMK